jgi:enamine deaminase RidA (YjgF/YER057c/UK114 family)
MVNDVRRYLRLPEELESLWCLSQAVQVGRVVHIAGILPLAVSGELEGETLVQQSKSVYAHVDDALRYFGLDRSAVITETVYVTDMDAATSGGLFPRNEFYANVSPPPPMTLLGVAALAVPGALIEVVLTADAPEVGDPVHG